MSYDPLMRVTKGHILDEIRRTANLNGGKPLGAQRFASETGIREPDWKGRHWARWSDAVLEAGLSPNSLNQPYRESELLRRYARLALELGHLPVETEIRLRKRQGLDFPEWKTIGTRFGGKAKFIAKLREFCQSKSEFASVATLCDAYSPRKPKSQDIPSAETGQPGFVYLVQHGSRREYKLGRTNNPLRREGEIRFELPERINPIHYFETDDASGIEAYWLKRFADRRKNGEWFALTAADVAAFKRRRTFM